MTDTTELLNDAMIDPVTGEVIDQKDPGLDESVKQRLAGQAREHGRSMEAEVREILTRAAHRPHIGLALLHAARDAGGTDELQIPARTDSARMVDFG